VHVVDDDDAGHLSDTSSGRDRALERQGILRALKAVRRGDFSIRLDPDDESIDPTVSEALNDVIELNRRMAAELRRIRRVVGGEGRIRERASAHDLRGEWARAVESVNELIADLTVPTIEIGRVLGAVAKGDLTERMATEFDGRPLKGEFRRSAEIVNTMVDQLNAFASEVTRVAREVGTEGKLGGQAEVRGVAGTWKA
jgi:HAMP domain-containing protein